jgi:hypothetical protein
LAKVADRAKKLFRNEKESFFLYLETFREPILCIHEKCISTTAHKMLERDEYAKEHPSSWHWSCIFFTLIISLETTSRNPVENPSSEVKGEGVEILTKAILLQKEEKRHEKRRFYVVGTYGCGGHYSHFRHYCYPGFYQVAPCKKT